MTEQRARRPPLAPKPSAAVFPERQPEQNISTALRGATSAFKPAKDAKTPTTQGSSKSALVAAVTAGKQKPDTVARDTDKPNRNVSPFRGRSDLSIDHRNVVSPITQPSEKQDLSFQRSASTLAARAASTSASPSRAQNEDFKTQRSHRGNKQLRISQSRERSSSTVLNLSALSGATASMAVSPESKNLQKSPGIPTKIDFNRIPGLPQRYSTSSSTSQPSMSTSRSPFTQMGSRDSMSYPSELQSPTSMSDILSSDTLSLNNTRTESPIPSPAITVSSPGPGQSKGGYFHSPLPSGQIDIQRSDPIPIREGRTTRIPTHARTLDDRNDTEHHRHGMAVSNLADAMMASSLASSLAPSRAASPIRLKPPPTTRRRSRSVNVLGARSHDLDSYHEKGMILVRPMKHTLRKHSSDHEGNESEPHRRGRRHWMRKHPNMHHEGDRKRWRDKITEVERKRYEGVWAANRGLLGDFEGSDSDLSTEHQGLSRSDLVVSIVVRDIWERSRLPRDVLEEVWDLVAVDGSKWLTREEFVIGLWLIDLRLKGRKLPSRISPSVWSSVRHTQGVKISSKPIKG